VTSLESKERYGKEPYFPKHLLCARQAGGTLHILFYLIFKVSPCHFHFSGRDVMTIELVADESQILTMSV
jgi:hypothetical protein